MQASAYGSTVSGIPRSPAPGAADAIRRDGTEELQAVSCLDGKTRALAYLAVLAALQMESGLASQVARAKLAGASREEVMSAIMVGVPAAGVTILRMLPTVISAYEEPYHRGQE